MRRPIAVQLLIYLAASASALAQEPAVSESQRESPSGDAEERVVDREAAAALLSDLFDADAAHGAADGGALTADDIAAMLRDYAGCEVVADALMADLTRTAADPQPSEPAEEAR